MGSILEIAPIPQIHPIAYNAVSDEDAIRQAWESVGDHLRSAMEGVRHDS
jgi:hypothetical protein